MLSVAPADPATATTLNFVVVGAIRSGAAAVASALAHAPHTVCHLNLLHEDDRARRAAHATYFGAACPDVPEHLGPWISPYQYLGQRVFDCALRGETAIGVRATYSQLRAYDLFPLFRERHAQGDFCLVHVRRNPVACFVSLCQARRSGLWVRPQNAAPEAYLPPAVPLDPAELTAFVRDQEAIRGKVESCCPDCLTISHRELVRDGESALRRIYQFLERPGGRPAAPATLRLRNRPIRERVSNFEAARARVPADVRALIDAEDLY